MAKVTFDKERCKGCKLCIEVCPRNIIIVSDRINSKGYHPAVVIEMEKCTGCAACATICPDCAIEVER
ncbi:MAG TPA: 4Fe-4S dicluster domain-containing protein [Clostridiaceae bacterium]|nr:4Fe-4S dicluster domain-containing protein [Clostridiaceae bacterium]